MIAMKAKKQWTNVISYSKDEYLTREKFEMLRSDVKEAWQALGWLHLRMTNDIDTKNPSPLSRPELMGRLQEVKKQIEKMMVSCLDEKHETGAD